MRYFNILQKSTTSTKKHEISLFKSLQIRVDRYKLKQRHKTNSLQHLKNHQNLSKSGIFCKILKYRIFHMGQVKN